MRKSVVAQLKNMVPTKLKKVLIAQFKGNIRLLPIKYCWNISVCSASCPKKFGLVWFLSMHSGQVNFSFTSTLVDVKL